MKKIVILGSTGSIGCSTLSVIRQNSEKYSVFALVSAQNVEKMLIQCIEFQPDYAVMVDENAANILRTALHSQNIQTEVLTGAHAIEQIVAHENVDCVMSAIVGAAGLLPTLAAIKKGKQILLANKEALVMCGQLFMKAIVKYGAELLPIDSEHNAIFQSLPVALQRNLGRGSLDDHGVKSLLLTGSGGPFRSRCLETFSAVTIEEACAHPNWNMGRKISVDSATMMNKGLEYIEARWLFNTKPNEIEVVIHPQSIIHSMVRYVDGSVIAQMGNPNMCTPIAYAMAYPNRIDAGVTPLDFTSLQQLTFEQPDYRRYPCLKLAIDACLSGQVATTVLNAANEVAVAAFLDRKISFLKINQIVDTTLEKIVFAEPQSIDDVLAIDFEARKMALSCIL